MICETRLLNLLRSLNEASSMLPLQNICIPHILPLVEMLDRAPNDLDTLWSWETGKNDFGLNILLAHLDTARIMTEQCGLYRTTAENILGTTFSPRRDMLDVFRTEMHLKLLWGARGACVNRNDRYAKFEEVLSVLSERAEPTQGQPETSV